MKPEHQRLLHEMFGEPAGDGTREATLCAASRILRHRRWRRHAAQSLAVMMTVVLGTLVVQLSTAPGNRSAAPAPPLAATTSSPVQVLSDDELLALFPDTPVGLVTLPDGRKRLIFPRPGDEQRFIVRL